MQSKSQTDSPVNSQNRPKFDASATRRANYITILAMKKRMLHLAGVDNRDADTILAICASQPTFKPAFTPFQVSNETIGRKLCLSQQGRQSVKRAAQRRQAILFNQTQPTIGYQFICRILGEYDPKKGISEKHTYIDYLTPAADEAYQSAIQSEEWRQLTGIQKAELLEQYAARALAELIPHLEPERGDPPETEQSKMNLSDYTQHRLRQILASLKTTANKIEDEYESAPEAIRLLREVSQACNQEIHRRAKVKIPPPTTENHLSSSLHCQLSADESQKRGEEEEGSGFNQADTDGPPELVASGPEIGDEELSRGDILSPLPPANPIENNRLEPPIPRELQINPRFAWVQTYVERGFNVVANHYLAGPGVCSCSRGVACESTAKHPATEHGVKDATQDLAKLADLWRRRPFLNPGLAAGEKSGFIALDFDKEDGAKLYQEFKERGWIPETLEAITSAESDRRGRHVLLKFFPGLKNNVTLLPGLDIRTDGGQIVVEPSRNAKGYYQWVSFSTPIAEAPAELREFLLTKTAESSEKKTKTKTAAKQPEKQAIPVEPGKSDLSDQEQFYKDYPDGVRNKALFRVASGLRGKLGASEAQIIAELRIRNAKVQTAQLSDSELQKIASSVCRYPAELESEQ